MGSLKTNFFLATAGSLFLMYILASASCLDVTGSNPILRMSESENACVIPWN